MLYILLLSFRIYLYPLSIPLYLYIMLYIHNSVIMVICIPIMGELLTMQCIDIRKTIEQQYITGSVYIPGTIYKAHKT